MDAANSPRACGNRTLDNSFTMKDLESFPVAILGYGITGKALAEFLRNRHISYEIFDEFAPEKTEKIHRKFRPIPRQWVIYSPSFFNSPWLEIAKKKRCRCLQELEFCRQFWQGNCIAVTGTNGKTSTTRILEHLLRRRQISSIATGNIGLPLISQISQLEEDPQRWIICEVSSFQAAGLNHFNPDFLLWTNFAPNHLDAHGSLEAYFRAKWNLAQQTQRQILYDETVEIYRRQFHLDSLPTATVFHAAAAPIFSKKLPAFDYAAQRKNLQMSAQLLQSNGLIDELKAEDLADFRLPPHRLCRFHRWNSHYFWNDSKATNAMAAENALQHVRPQTNHLIWITGGQSKGEALDNFRKAVDLADEIIVLGEIGIEFRKHFPTAKAHFILQKETLVFTIKALLLEAKISNAVVFSPGLASFDQFSSYVERGEWFESQIHDHFSN